MVPSQASSPAAPPRAPAVKPTRLSERYLLCAMLASGGMATVHLGRLVGPAAFARTVAIKRLLPHYAKEHDFRLMLADEARLAARVRHPNVVQMLDVVSTDAELFLVMEYVDGASLRRLSSLTADRRVPQPILAGIVSQFLHGLHAAHEAIDEAGSPLSIVHRDVSPDNVLVGVDGLARVLDFGIAKATSRLQSTRDGQLKGKLGYMAPEQLSGRATRQSDVFSASIVLWEGLAGARLFRANDDGETIGKVLAGVVDPPSVLVPDVHPALEAIVMRGLERDPRRRWPTAREMALAIERDVPTATPTQIGAWVESLDGVALAERRARVRATERAEVGIEAAATLPDASEIEAALPAPEEVPPSREPPGVRTRTAVIVGAFAAIAEVGWLAFAPARTTGVGPAPSSHPATAVGIAPPPLEVPATSGSTPAMPQNAPTSAASVTTPAPSARRAAAPAATPARAGCNPPYRLGPMGEKIWLKACL